MIRSSACPLRQADPAQSGRHGDRISYTTSRDIIPSCARTRIVRLARRAPVPSGWMRALQQASMVKPMPRTELDHLEPEPVWILGFVPVRDGALQPASPPPPEGVEGVKRRHVLEQVRRGAANPAKNPTRGLSGLEGFVKIAQSEGEDCWRVARCPTRLRDRFSLPTSSP